MQPCYTVRVLIPVFFYFRLLTCRNNLEYRAEALRNSYALEKYSTTAEVRRVWNFEENDHNSKSDLLNYVLNVF